MSLYRFVNPAPLVFLAACAGVPAENSQHPRLQQIASPSATPQQTSLSAEQLAGSWRLVTVNGQTVEPDQLAINFRQQSFNADVNCNTVSGRYSLEQSRFVPDLAVATERGCGPEYIHDRALTRALQTGFVVTHLDNRRLEARVGDMALVFARKS